MPRYSPVEFGVADLEFADLDNQLVDSNHGESHHTPIKTINGLHAPFDSTAAEVEERNGHHATIDC